MRQFLEIPYLMNICCVWHSLQKLPYLSGSQSGARLFNICKTNAPFTLMTLFQ